MKWIMKIMMIIIIMKNDNNNEIMINEINN